MSFKSSHQSSIIITPATLKEQIIIRINTLVNRNGGSYYEYDEHGVPMPITTIEDADVCGIETKGRDVYIMTHVPDDFGNVDDALIPYNANEFFLEQLWDVYMACEPIYQHKFLDYATIQE
jgi:hypothetical protein